MSADLTLPALGPGSALDSFGLRALQMMARNPFLSVGLGASCDRGTVRLRLLASNLGLLDGCLGLDFLLLWEVGGNPDVVEEVADATGAGEEEEVQEDAAELLAKSWGGRGGPKHTSEDRRWTSLAQQPGQCH